jgi:hypothetical protein
VRTVDPGMAAAVVAEVLVKAEAAEFAAAAMAESLVERQEVLGLENQLLATD